MEVGLLILRLILAAIFAVAGIGKLLDLKGSESAIAGFGVPKSLAKPFSILLPLAEIAFAICLLFIETSWFGAVGCLILLGIFIGAMIYQMAKGNAPDCHCFGQIHSEPVGKKSLVRNIVISVFAAVLAVPGKNHQGIDIFENGFETAGKFDPMQIILGLAIVVLLAAIIYFLKQISEQQVKVLRRIEMLEVLSGGGLERENIGHPQDGLPIGAPAPNFALPNISGKVLEFDHLLANAKPMLFFFVSPTCAPCAALLPEIAQWKEEFAGKLEFIFVSSGKAKENIEKFGETGNQILLQKEREVSELFGALWTPTALLINSDGTIGSRTAAGDEAIRTLVAKVKEKAAKSDPIYVSNGEEGPRKFKIGEAIPNFKVQSLTGENVETENLLGKKTLVAFWSATCPHCVNMLDDLREWEKVKGLNEPNLIVFSSGDVEVHKKFELKSPIVLEEDYKVAAELGMSGTPSAVLVSETGKFISETAIGADQIWALIGKRK